MYKLLKKEWKLAASPLSYLFLAFTLMAFIPAYPILLSAFFVCFGLFHSYQSGRENNDIVYTALLPVEKRDIVGAKFAFNLSIQALALLLGIVFVAIRMAAVGDAGPYGANAMMNANIAYLGYSLIVFGLFNRVFTTGFFRTGYKFAKPFVLFLILTFLVVIAAEALHFIPGLTALNGNHPAPVQWIALGAGCALFALLTLRGLSLARRRFDRVDL